MNIAEKERIVFSAALAVVLYATFFLVTWKLNIFKPSEKPSFAGPLIVEVVLRPSLSPVEITAEVEPELAPREPEPPEVTPVEPEPVEPTSRIPDQTEPDPTPPEPVDTTPREPEPLPPEAADSAPEDSAPLLDSEAASEDTPVTEVTQEVTPGAEEPPDVAAQVKEPAEPGIDLEYSEPIDDAAAIEEYKSPLLDDRKTDEFADAEIVYGDTTPDDSEQIAEVAQADTQLQENLVDLNVLDSIQTTPAGDTGNSGDTGSESSDAAAASIGELIVAEDLEDLTKLRRILYREDPVLESGSLAEGQRFIEVDVLFVILSSGLVKEVALSRSSGYAGVDTLIRSAIRKWKFQPISGDREVQVRLTYKINAK